VIYTPADVKLMFKQNAEWRQLMQMSLLFLRPSQFLWQTVQNSLLL